MANQVFMITEEKKKELEEELIELKGPRTKENTAKIAEARAQGDLSENAEYSAAREEQGHIQGRISEITAILNNCQIIKVDKSKKSVGIGCTVKLLDVTYEEEVEYTIVGSTEANPRAGLLSNESPLAKAILGKAVGDEVIVSSGEGDEPYKILEIK